MRPLVILMHRKTLFWTLLPAGALALAASGTLRPARAQEAREAPEAREAREAPATLTVHADQTGPRVNPSLYGVFFEEINHAGDGGLYAELVRNRDFQESDPRGGQPMAWTLRSEAGAQGKISLDGDLPPGAAGAHSLRLEAGGAGRVTLANDGYWGVPVRAGARYHLSFFVRRSETLHTPVRVTLESAGGEVYARTALRNLSPTWQRVTATLTPSATDPAARLVLGVDAPGTVWLDEVSLFPERTFRRRSNGLRADLAEQVSAIRPAFVRFPGGCFVEGNRLSCAFRWKSTLGDIAARPGHLNDNWGYRSTDGLGYHEYLQWCEDLGAEPLFVVNCGLSHHDVVPMEQLQPWVQDALDAIEYANGPVTSQWGALRAKNGHPKPFNLRYVEIGNENGMFGNTFGGTHAQYAERYRVFYDAIKRQYPTIVTIANTRVPHPTELVDDHYYNSPAWFWENMGYYDAYARSGPKVYVGEYAVTQNCGKGNLRAALAEAAWMTGLERNADVVRMASYAPLFVNANDRRWNPDAIVFDGLRSYGTPSYYVQKLFAASRPDVILPSELHAEPGAVTVEKGGIGLGTWATRAEFRDVEVRQDGKTLYASSFPSGAADWRSLRGQWSVVDGAYRQTSPETNMRAVLDAPALSGLSDYTLHLKARKLAGSEGFLILFRVRGDEQYYWWNIGGWQNREHGIERSDGAEKVQLGSHVPGHIETGRWYDIRVELSGPRIRCYLDGKLIHDVQEQPVPNLAAAAGRADGSGDLILKVVNGADVPRTVRINLEGAGSLRRTGRETVLTGGSMDAENSLEQPEKIAPETRPLSGLGRRFTHTFPPRSVTVLRLQRK